jgi:putative addiction module killer protein
LFGLTAFTTENYSSHYSVIELAKSAAFESWFSGLQDVQARARITARIRRLSLGNAGDVKPLGAGVSEMRINRGHSTGIGHC